MNSQPTKPRPDDAVILARPFAERAEAVLACAFHGIHHCFNIKKGIRGVPNRWEVNSMNDMSTHDFDMLTRLVVSAHVNCIRVSLQPSGPRMIKIVLNERTGREGEFAKRHPSMESAIDELWNSKYPPAV